MKCYVYMGTHIHANVTYITDLPTTQPQIPRAAGGGHGRVGSGKAGGAGGRAEQAGEWIGRADERNAIGIHKHQHLDAQPHNPNPIPQTCALPGALNVRLEVRALNVRLKLAP